MGRRGSSLSLPHQLGCLANGLGLIPMASGLAPDARPPKQGLAMFMLPCGAYVARRALLIRRVTTKPSVCQSRATEPPSWLDMVRATSLLPKPVGAAGAVTGGPPRSDQTSTTSALWAGHDTSSLPPAAESAPYLIELAPIRFS